MVTRRSLLLSPLQVKDPPNVAACAYDVSNTDSFGDLLWYWPAPSDVLASSSRVACLGSRFVVATSFVEKNTFNINVEIAVVDGTAVNSVGQPALITKETVSASNDAIPSQPSLVTDRLSGGAAWIGTRSGATQNITFISATNGRSTTAITGIGQSDSVMAQNTDNYRGMERRSPSGNYFVVGMRHSTTAARFFVMNGSDGTVSHTIDFTVPNGVSGFIYDNCSYTVDDSGNVGLCLGTTSSGNVVIFDSSGTVLGEISALSRSAPFVMDGSNVYLAQTTSLFRSVTYSGTENWVTSVSDVPDGPITLTSDGACAYYGVQGLTTIKQLKETVALDTSSGAVLGGYTAGSADACLPRILEGGAAVFAESGYLKRSEKTGVLSRSRGVYEGYVSVPSTGQSAYSRFAVDDVNSVAVFHSRYPLSSSPSVSISDIMPPGVTPLQWVSSL